jgi:hypothetical protein
LKKKAAEAGLALGTTSNGTSAPRTPAAKRPRGKKTNGVDGEDEASPTKKAKKTGAAVKGRKKSTAPIKDEEVEDADDGGEENELKTELKDEGSQSED